jgi:hypothetical protein
VRASVFEWLPGHVIWSCLPSAWRAFGGSTNERRCVPRISRLFQVASLCPFGSRRVRTRVVALDMRTVTERLGRCPPRTNACTPVTLTARLVLGEPLREELVVAEGCDGELGAGVAVPVLPGLPPGLPLPVAPPPLPPPPPPPLPLPLPPAEGVTGFEAADGGPVPAELAAVTVNVYVVALARPVTVSGLPAPAAVNPPGEDLTV